MIDGNWESIASRQFSVHQKKGSPPAVKVTFTTDSGRRQLHWCCPENGGRAKSLANRWWHDHGGERPFPDTIDEFLSRTTELAATTYILTKQEHKYRFVVDVRVAVPNLRAPTRATG